MEDKRSVDEFSFEELMKQIRLTKKQGRKFTLYRLYSRLLDYIPVQKVKDKITLEDLKKDFDENSKKILELFDSIPSEELERNILIKDFEIIFQKDSKKAFNLLESIPSNELRNEIRLKIFKIIFEMEDLDSALKKLASLSCKELQDNIISQNFEIILQIDSDKAFEQFNFLSSKNLQDNIVIKYFKIMFEINSDKAFKLLDSISLDKDKDKIIAKNFFSLYLQNQIKALKLLDFISNNIQKNEIVIDAFFEDILDKNKNSAFKLLNSISIDKKDEIISRYFSLLLFTDKDKSFQLLDSLQNNKLKQETIIDNFRIMFLEDRVIAIRLIDSIDIELKKELVFKSFMEFYDEDISNAVNLFKLMSILEEKKELLLVYKKKSIEKLSFVQDNLDNNLQKKAILESYKNIFLDKDSIILNISFIFSILPKIENTESFINLLEEIENKLILADLENDYEELIELIVSKSQNKNIYKLKFFIKNKLDSYIEKKDLKRVISDILNNIIEKENKEESFIEEFIKYYNMNTLFRFIPEVAKRDSNLAISLLDRLEYLHHLSIEEIFLELYKSDFSKSLVYYNKLDDFYTKEKLSKQAITHHLPTFSSSFFYKSLSALDSHNIMNTLDELATLAPKEVLKYYGEIEDKDENLLDELLKKIVDLQNRAKKAEELNDEKIFEEILEEEKKLKISIRVDEKLFKLFLDKYEMNNMKFMRLSLLDFEVE